MKSLRRKKAAFLLVMVLFAAALYGLTLFDDYRASIAGFMLLCCLTFGLSAWTWIKSTKLITGVLIAALALSPVRASEPPPNDAQKDSTLLVACCLVVVGGIIVYAVYKICKKMPQIKKNLDAPRTNDVDSANSPPLTNVVTALRMPDGASTDASDWEAVPITFQTSTNGRDWHNEYTVTNWLSSNLVVSVIYSNTVPLQTNAAPVYWTNDPVMINFSSVMPASETAPVKLWRAVETQ